MKIKIFMSISLFILFSTSSYFRNMTWRYDVTLWEDVVKKSPEKKRAHDNLGLAYYMEGRFEEAIKEYLPILKSQKAKDKGKEFIFNF